MWPRPAPIWHPITPPIRPPASIPARRTVLASPVINRFTPALAHRFRYLDFAIERSCFEHPGVFVKIMANFMTCIAMTMLATASIDDAGKNRCYDGKRDARFACQRIHAALLPVKNDRHYNVG